MATNNAINSNIPIEIAKGGTNASSMTNTFGVNYFDGTQLVTTTVGTATQVLTSNGPGVAPTFQAAGGGGVTSIAGTANQITASASTGAVTLSTPSTFIAPGTIASTTTNAAGTNFLLPTTSASAGQLKINNVVYLHAAGTGNVFLGNAAGSLSIASVNNTGMGAQVLSGSTIGNSNTGMGYRCLVNDSAYTENTAFGSGALGAALTGSYNTAGGSGAGNGVTSGQMNTFFGRDAGTLVNTGSNNTCLGYVSGFFTTGSNNTCVGYNAGLNYTSSESSNIVINNNGTVSESNVLRIGAATGTGAQQINSAFICGITGITVTGTAVLVSTSNQLGVAVSSVRYKENIKDMASQSEDLYALRPVTFNMKSDASKVKSFGLIAEEVYNVIPDLIILDKEDKPQSVKYHELPAMLLNELQKLNKRLADLEDIVHG